MERSAMPRAEIIWKRRAPERDTIQVKARHFGDQWKFFVRDARYEQWRPVDAPPLEDWLTLLDAVRRRLGRGFVRPEDIAQLERTIRERFPAAEL
jgi:hypothetical protein